jgi:hypothetical protein
VDFEQAHVGRDEVPYPQCHHIAGNELRHVNLGGLAVSPYKRPTSDPVVECGYGYFSPELVEETKRHAETDNDGDDDGVRGVTGQSGDAGA